MAKHKKQAAEEEGGGESAPLWIISFADMISLLMAFFVMLSSFSTYGPKAKADLKNIANAVVAPYGGWFQTPPKSGLGTKQKMSGQTPEGAEKPTLEQTQEMDSINETSPKDFRSEKVFSIASSEIFYLGGTALTTGGKDFLDTMATYLQKLPARIVICENKPEKTDDLGVNRSIAIVEYLVSKGIPRQCCNLTPALMFTGYKDRMRMVEITLLEESIYK
ncbi:MAG: hypothetical protein A2Y07_09170 [Planctomycetes bacterium GWF2_50_10]|nr:MAG: hypothetical protein A2Y07_09170 [Planctomycetes bacterium GWF2_50_10]